MTLQSLANIPRTRFAEAADESHPLAKEISDEIKYLANERGCMIALRLQKLCESKIYDQACSLAARALRALRSCNSKHSLRRTTSPSQQGYILDLYLVLLYYLRRPFEFMAEIRALDLKHAVAFCGRYPPQPQQIVQRLLPYYGLVIDKALQIFLAQFLSTKLATDEDQLLRSLCVDWMNRNLCHANYQQRLRHLVTLCTAISKM